MSVPILNADNDVQIAADGNQIKSAKWQYAFFVVTTYLFTFQDYIQSLIPLFRYFDEVFALLAVAICVLRHIMSPDFPNLRIQIKKGNFITPLMFFIIAGLVSSIMNRYQPWSNTFSDLYLCLKFWLAMYAGYRLFCKMDLKTYAKRLYAHCVIITGLFLFMLLVGLFSEYVLNASSSYFGVERFGIPSLVLLYRHPNSLANVIAFILIICVSIRAYVPKVNWCIVLLLLLQLGTLRAKALASVAVFVLLLYLIVIWKKKFSFTTVLAVLPLAVIIGWTQISFYFYEITESARQQLTVTSFEILRNHFPFGTGFGTFASHFSIEPYSPVYHLYGLNVVDGIRPDHIMLGRSFITDTFWPMIIGQTGLIGALAYVGLLLRLFFRTQGLRQSNKYIYFAAVYGFFHMLISSTADSAFVHYLSVPIAMMMGVLFATGERKNSDTDMVENLGEAQ